MVGNVVARDVEGDDEGRARAMRLFVGWGVGFAECEDGVGFEGWSGGGGGREIEVGVGGG